MAAPQRAALLFSSVQESPHDMAQEYPLMPHATASWLVDNTALTFEQIAAFCGLHSLEIQAIADETATARHIPRDPVRAGDLSPMRSFRDRSSAGSGKWRPRPGRDRAV